MASPSLALQRPATSTSASKDNAFYRRSERPHKGWPLFPTLDGSDRTLKKPVAANPRHQPRVKEVRQHDADDAGRSVNFVRRTRFSGKPQLISRRRSSTARSRSDWLRGSPCKRVWGRADVQVLQIAPSTWHEHARRKADPDRLPERAKRDAELSVHIRRIWRRPPHGCRRIISFVMARTVSSNDLFPAARSRSRNSASARSRGMCLSMTLAHFCTVSLDATTPPSYLAGTCAPSEL
jgi:hypothetical protein